MPHSLEPIRKVPALLPSMLNTQTASVRPISMVALTGTDSVHSDTPQREMGKFLQEERRRLGPPTNPRDRPGAERCVAVRRGEEEKGPGEVKALLRDSGHLLPRTSATSSRWELGCGAESLGASRLVPV